VVKKTNDKFCPRNFTSGFIPCAHGFLARFQAVGKNFSNVGLFVFWKHLPWQNFTFRVLRDLTKKQKRKKKISKEWNGVFHNAPFFCFWW
jgi:hypothetical protein